MTITYIGLGATLIMTLMIANGYWHLVPLQRIKSVCILLLSFAATLMAMPHLNEMLKPYLPKLVDVIAAEKSIMAIAAFMVWVAIIVIINQFLLGFNKGKIGRKIGQSIPLFRIKPIAGNEKPVSISKDEVKETLAEIGYKNVPDAHLKEIYFQQMGNMLKTILLGFFMFCMVPCYVMNEQTLKTDIGIVLANPLSQLSPLILVFIALAGMYYFIAMVIKKAGMVESDSQKVKIKVPCTKYVISIITAVLKGYVIVIIYYCFLSMAISPELLQKMAKESEIVSGIQWSLYQLQPLFPEDTGITFIEPK